LSFDFLTRDRYSLPIRVKKEELTLQAAMRVTRVTPALVIAMFAAILLLPPTAAAQDLDCPQFTQPEAQSILEQDPSDPNRLDADGDGIACEDRPSGGTPTASSGSSGHSASSESTGQLASTGFNAWELVVVGIAGIGGAVALRRRARTLS
jgi:hypothetical protein